MSLLYVIKIMINAKSLWIRLKKCFKKSLIQEFINNCTHTHTHAHTHAILASLSRKYFTREHRKTFLVENLPATHKAWVWSLDLEDALEEEMTTHSIILAWRILWTEEPDRLQSMGWQRVRHTFTFCIGRSHNFWKAKKKASSLSFQKWLETRGEPRELLCVPCSGKLRTKEAFLLAASFTVSLLLPWCTPATGMGTSHPTSPSDFITPFKWKRNQATGRYRVGHF